MTYLRTAAVIAALATAVTLSGCIMIVGDHDKDDMNYHTTKPAPDEKPADTLPGNPT